ncbi:hypothetical protein B296_00056262 [Ensete ventricosum]|uniref:Uncharacterized protein n=1 Tax=Ensete ventricosum TaxID=4639 RepID=A0A426X0T2_ENSVE|nr:hypothetical protein B296_00056262 [Ensete ventricosum]
MSSPTHEAKKRTEKNLRETIARDLRHRHHLTLNVARARQDNPPSRAQYLRAGSEATSRGILVVERADEAQVAPHLQTLRSVTRPFRPPISVARCLKIRELRRLCPPKSVRVFYVRCRRCVLWWCMQRVCENDSVCSNILETGTSAKAPISPPPPPSPLLNVQGRRQHPPLVHHHLINGRSLECFPPCLFSGTISAVSSGVRLGQPFLCLSTFLASPLTSNLAGEPVESHTRSSGSSFSAAEECWRSIGGDNACAHGEASRRPDYTLLLEPKQDALAAVIRSAQHPLPSLLPDFFNATIGASDFCGSLVESIRRARVDQIELHKGFPVPDARRRPVTTTLRCLSRLHDPFSDSARLQFERIHRAFDPLVRRLIHAHRRSMRRLSYADFAVRAASFFTCGVAVTIQAPFARAEAQLGAAARGAFALDRDFDTMGSMVRRLGDEIEHTRDVIKLFTDDGDDDMGEGLMLKEVARELRVSGCEFMNKLAELEEHVFLCFLNINRTRRMVMQEIVAHRQR